MHLVLIIKKDLTASASWTVCTRRKLKVKEMLFERNLMQTYSKYTLRKFLQFFWYWNFVYCKKWTVVNGTISTDMPMQAMKYFTMCLNFLILGDTFSKKVLFLCILPFFSTANFSIEKPRWEKQFKIFRRQVLLITRPSYTVNCKKTQEL
jgi:hypothetical protein